MVFGLCEVVGGIAEMRLLRKWASKHRYDIRWCCGEDEHRQTGVVLMVDRLAAALVQSSRIDERVIGCVVASKVSGAKHAFAVWHGHFGVGFKRQLKSVIDFLEQHGGGLSLADHNQVPCMLWRRTPKPIGSCGRALRTAVSWKCQCCDDGTVCASNCCRIVGGREGTSSSAGTGWTRFEVARAGSELVWGPPTSRYDWATEVGVEVERWQLEDELFAESGSGAPLSDHTMLIVSRATPQVASRRTRPVDVLAAARRGRRTSKALRLLTAADDVDVAIREAAGLAASEGRSQGEAAQDVILGRARAARAAVDRMASDAHGARRSVSARCIYNDWKERRRVIVTLSKLGVDPRTLHAQRSGLMHPSAGLRATLERFWHESSAILWQRLRCIARRQMDRSGRHCMLRVRDWSRSVVAAARPREGDDERSAYLRTWARLANPVSSAAMAFFRRLDEVDGALVPASSAEAVTVTAEIGDAFVSSMDRGIVWQAARAWADIFLTKKEPLQNLAGGEWRVDVDMSFALFVQTLHTMPRRKAVGFSGFSTDWLRAFERGGAVQRAFYDAVVSDLRTHSIPQSWRVVMYALLVKPPPNDASFVGQRREIALMEQVQKTVLQTIRHSVYSRVSGRLHPAQLGWLAGYGCPHVGVKLELAVQQAAVTGQTIYVLWIDLATFFPSIDRRGLNLLELTEGVPEGVLDIAAAIYGSSTGGGIECCYDSAAGLGGFFKNHMGALMGCVLSPDRAKIFVNSVIVAIAMLVKGMRVWGSQPTSAAGVVLRLAQLAFADDWAGVFEDAYELVHAWRIWSLWTIVWGQQLGVKKKLKTAVSGARTVGGRRVSVEDPGLKFPDGSRVPFLLAHECYKHLGKLIAVDASLGHARGALLRKCGAIARKLRRLRFVSQREFCTVADTLYGGYANFYCASAVITWKEADEKIEAGFRASFNSTFRRAHSSARAPLYEPRGAQRPLRRHFWVSAASALYTNVVECLSERHPCDQRNMMRAHIAMTMSRWGCTGDPLAYDFSSLEGELVQKIETGGVRLLGEGWMLAATVLDRQVRSASDAERAKTQTDTGVDWRGGTARLALSESLPPGDPFEHSSAWFAAYDSPAIFGAQIEGLTLAPCAELLNAQLTAIGVFCTDGDDGFPRWVANFAEARELNPELAGGPRARARWNEAMDELRMWTEPTTPEEPRLARAALAHECVLAAARRREAVRARGPAHEALVRKLIGARDAGDEMVGLEAWKADLRQTLLVGDAEPYDATWDTGAPDVEALAEGVCLFLDAKDGCRSVGGERRWRVRPMVGADGFVSPEGSPLLYEAMGYVELDERAYLVTSAIHEHGYGVPLEQFEMDGLPPAVPLYILCRRRLDEQAVAAGAEVVVIEAPVGKLDAKTHGFDAKDVVVNLTQARAAFERALLWCLRTDADAMATMDASWAGAEAGKAGASDAAGDDGGATNVAGFSVLWHDGTVSWGSLVGEEDMPDNYRGEMAAQMLAARVARERGWRRPVFWFDATSPPSALWSFVGSCYHKQERKLWSRWLDTWWQDLRGLECAALLWQTSHAGEVFNDAVDVDAARARAEGLAGDGDGCGPPRLHPASYASMEVIGATRGVRRWAAGLLAREVGRRLHVSGSGGTQFRAATDLDIGALPGELDALADAVLGARAQVGDRRRYRGRLGRIIARCPFDCGCKFDWYDVQFRCTGEPIRRVRALWQQAVDAVEVGLADRFVVAVPHEGWATLTRAMRDAERGPARAHGSGGEVMLRRIVGGCVEPTGSPGYDNGIPALRMVNAAVCAGLRVQAAGRRATAGDERAVRKFYGALKVARRGLMAWLRRVAALGPARVAALRAAWDARAMVADWGRRAVSHGWQAARVRDGVARASGLLAQVWRDTHTVAAVSESVALRQWRWLALLRHWRLRTAARRAPAAVVVPWDETHVAALVAAMGGVTALPPRTIGVQDSEWSGFGVIAASPGLDARWVAARRVLRRHSARARLAFLARWESAAGRAADPRGRWAVEDLLGTRVPVGRARLEVLVRWLGSAWDGSPWHPSWLPITWLTADQRRVAWRLHGAGKRKVHDASAAGPRRRSPRLRLGSSEGAGGTATGSPGGIPVATAFEVALVATQGAGSAHAGAAVVHAVPLAWGRVDGPARPPAAGAAVAVQALSIVEARAVSGAAPAQMTVAQAVPLARGAAVAVSARSFHGRGVQGEAAGV